MLEFLLHPFVLGPLCLAVGALIGVGLGRNSSRGNAYYDAMRAKLASAEAEIQRLRDRANR